MNEIMPEEEVFFAQRLSKFGKIVRDPHAISFSSPRRFFCGANDEERFCVDIKLSKRF
jgi:hypothetical protein